MTRNSTTTSPQPAGNTANTYFFSITNSFKTMYFVFSTIYHLNLKFPIQNSTPRAPRERDRSERFVDWSAILEKS